MASDSAILPGPKRKSPFNVIQRILIWLSGSSEDALAKCPRWEQRKYEAFGATVLVPTVFAMIASAYAVSTLTPNLGVIIPVSLIWGFIILTIDRVLLATYRAFASFFVKISQFLLRIVVALLVGFTIAHPLTLLLFKDTIITEVERERRAEMQAIVEAAEVEKSALDQRITDAETALSEQQAKYQETVTANFMEQDDAGQNQPIVPQREPEERAALDQQVEQATQALQTQVGSIDQQMTEHNAAYAKVQEELSHWQEQYENEVNGSRSGVAGIGPRAKSIEQDQLAWRRDEVRRLGSLMTSLTQTRNQLINDIASTEKQLRDEYNAAIAAEAADMRANRQEVAALERQLQSQQLNIFLANQEELLEQIQSQIDSNSANLTRLRDESAALAAGTQELVDEVGAQPRNDLLTQTLVLHGLFESGSEGGNFALMVYIVIAGLFMLVDTIPLVVKFFSKAGPYDYRVLQEERLAKVAASIDPEMEDDFSRVLVDRRMEKFDRLKELQAAAFSVGFSHEGAHKILELPREVYEEAEPTQAEGDVRGSVAAAAAAAKTTTTTSSTTTPTNGDRDLDPHDGFGESLILPKVEEDIYGPKAEPEVVNRIAPEPARIAEPEAEPQPEPVLERPQSNGNGDRPREIELASQNGNSNGNGNGAGPLHQEIESEPEPPEYFEPLAQSEVVEPAPVQPIEAEFPSVAAPAHDWTENRFVSEPELPAEDLVEPLQTELPLEENPAAAGPDDFVSDHANLPPETQLAHEPEPPQAPPYDEPAIEEPIFESEVVEETPAVETGAEKRLLSEPAQMAVVKPLEKRQPAPVPAPVAQQPQQTQQLIDPVPVSLPETTPAAEPTPAPAPVAQTQPIDPVPVSLPETTPAAEPTPEPAAVAAPNPDPAPAPAAPFDPSANEIYQGYSQTETQPEFDDSDLPSPGNPAEWAARLQESGEAYEQLEENGAVITRVNPNVLG